MKSKKRGQTLLITMLVMTIAVTIALSLIGRATTDIGMTSQIEDSARAFSAAEAGIEDALKNADAQSMKTDVEVAENTKYDYLIGDIGAGSDGTYSPQNSTANGDIETIWLVSPTTGLPDASATPRYEGTQINICWEHATPVPAIAVALVYWTGTEYAVFRDAYDPTRGTADDRTGTNKFTANIVSQTDGCGKTDVYAAQLNFPVGTPIMLRIRPLYNEAALTVAPVGGSIPSQGQEISSTGKTGGGVTRKIVVKRQYESAPPILDFAVYSQGSFSH